MDPRVRLIRDTGKGASRARNLGIKATSGLVIAFTDDDCEPDPDWLATLVSAMENDPSAGIAFGSVVPADHAPADGFIVGYRPVRQRRLTGRLGKLRDGGIGANMALRRDALSAVAGFDEQLGPGAYFTSSEEGDLAYRILKAGRSLLHVPGSSVIHHGFRDWSSGAGLTRRTYLGVTAAYMKHLRQADAVAALLLLQQLGFALANLCACLLRLRRPIGLGRLWGLVQGTWRSFELDVDERGLYQPRQVKHLPAKSSADGAKG
jgi:GT2 family glycosyltransferase